MMNETDVYFDNVEVGDLNVSLLENHEHPLLSGTRDNIITIPEVAGAIDYGGTLEPIAFNLPMGFLRKNRMELQWTVRQVKALLIDGNGKPKTFKLKFGYEPDKYYNVRYSGGIPIDRLIAKIGQFNLPLICYDGHALSVAMNDEVTWGSTVIPFASDFTMGHMGDGAKTFTGNGSTIINVTGDNLRPVLHVTGSGTNVSIKWGGKTLTLGTLANATWAIDLKEFEVTKDGSNAMHLIKGDWLNMDLMQGDNTVTVNGSGLNLTVSFQFRDLFY